MGIFVHASVGGVKGWGAVHAPQAMCLGVRRDDLVRVFPRLRALGTA